MARFTTFLTAVLLASGCSGGSGGSSGATDPGGTAGSQLLHASIVSGERLDGRDVAAFPDGSTLVMGEFVESIVLGEGEPNETTLGPSGGISVFVARYGPDGALEWARSVLTNEGGEVRGIALADGSAVVTGVMSGVVVFGTGESSETTFDTPFGSYIACFRPDGTLFWAKHIVSAAARDIAASDGQTFYVCGDFSDEAVFAAGEQDETTLASTPARDIFVARYHLDGGLFGWARRTVGGPDYSHHRAYAAAITPDGACLVAGYMKETCTFGLGEPNETTLTTEARNPVSYWFNPFVARWNGDGTLAWAKKADGNADALAFGIVALPDGSSAVAGILRKDPVDFGPGTTLQGPGLFVARYGPLGDLAWARGVMGAQDIEGAFDGAGGIAALPDGSLLVTGTFSGEARAGIGETNEILLEAPDVGAFLARYAGDGSLAWAGPVPGALWSEGHAVAADADGGFVWLCGFPQNGGLVLEDAVFPPRDEFGIFVARYGE